MAPYESENFKTLHFLQIAAKSFETFLEFFFPNGPHKTVFGIFEILSLRLLMI